MSSRRSSRLPIASVVVWTLAVLAPAIHACRQEDTGPVAINDMNASVDHAVMESMLVRVFPLVNALRAGPGAWQAMQTRTCAVVDSITGDTAVFPSNGPVTLHLRYPDPYCVDIDGRRRAGVLTITLTDVLTVPGAMAFVSSSDLKVDDYRYRFGLRDSVVAADSSIVRVDSGFIFTQGAFAPRYTGTYAYTVTDSTGGADPQNDAYSVVQSTQGLDREGMAYTAETTTTPMAVAIACRWATAGIVLVVPAEGHEQELDYGDGGCDDLARIRTQGQEVGLTIP